MRLWTIGHSTRPLDGFLDMLRAHGITRLIDVRTVPRSRRHPQFAQDALPASLAGAGIDYAHAPGLGGLRHARRDSTNLAWRNASFRGYADYMEAPEFARNLDTLVDQARQGRVAIMCAEAVPWRCHRSLIADALVARGVSVVHILDERHTQEHRLTPWAVVEGGRVRYPGPPELPGTAG